VDTLTTVSKRDSIRSALEISRPPTPCPSIEDGEQALSLVGDLISAADARIVARGLEIVRATTAQLAKEAGNVGLVHADGHQDNFMFHAGSVRLIDFDDCGWGFYLYDVAVPLSEITLRPRYREMRAALLDGYSLTRSLPDSADEHLDSFIVLRG